ncbi:class E sortase [Dermabacteraceae bacterium P13077]
MGSVKRLLWGLVGVCGEIAITLGAILVLFVVWQMWWTDVVAEQEQSQIVADLGSKWGQQKPAPETQTPRHTDTPPTIAKPKRYETWGLLHVPKFSRGPIPIAEDVSLEHVLNVIGAGHYPETALPGEIGNFSLAGHRTTYGKPFNEIALLEPGDEIIVETKDTFYVYTVASDEIVKPNDVRVIAPVPGQIGAQPSERWLTLTACHPLYSARERYIVHAKFAYYVKRDEGIPDALKGNK